MLKLTVNGKEQSFEQKEPKNLSELLEEMGIDEATVVAEIDGCIIERRIFNTTMLEAGQKIELIRFVGGG